MGSDDIVNAILGAARGLAAGSGGVARSDLRQHEQANAAFRSAGAQGLFGQEAARLKALYAQGQAAAQIAASTASVNAVYLPWMEERLRAEFITGERMRQLNEEARNYEATQKKRPQAVSPHDGSVVGPAQPTPATAEQCRGAAPEALSAYRAVELETHEDFAVRLAARPAKEKDDGKEGAV